MSISSLSFSEQAREMLKALVQSVEQESMQETYNGFRESISNDQHSVASLLTVQYHGLHLLREIYPDAYDKMLDCHQMAHELSEVEAKGDWD